MKPRSKKTNTRRKNSAPKRRRAPLVTIHDPRYPFMPHFANLP